MITMTIHGANPVQEVTARAIHRGLSVGEKITATTRDGKHTYTYAWLGDTVRYITKGE